MNILHTNTANLIFLLQSQNEKFLRFKGLFGRRKCVICCPYFYTSPWWIAHMDYLFMKSSHTNIDFAAGVGRGGVVVKKNHTRELDTMSNCYYDFFVFWGENFEGVGVLVGRSFINHSESSLFKSFK